MPTLQKTQVSALIAVGGSDDEYVRARLNAVHLIQKRAENPFLNSISRTRAAEPSIRDDRVHFVEQQ